MKRFGYVATIFTMLFCVLVSGVVYSSVNSVAAEESTTVKINDTDVSYSGSWGNYSHDTGSNWYMGTAHSTSTADNSFDFTFNNCSRIKMFAAKSSGSGTADVYINGAYFDTVSQVAAVKLPSTVFFDSGELTAGTYTVKLVTVGDGWVELDYIEAELNGTPSYVIHATHKNFFNYSKEWQFVSTPTGKTSGNYASVMVGGQVEISFTGTFVKLLGQKLTSGGSADIYIDNEYMGEISTRGAKAEWQTFFEKSGLTDTPHKLRIRHKGGGSVVLSGIECATYENFISKMNREAFTELNLITKGEKDYLTPDKWNPVTLGGRMPDSGVTLKDGVFLDAFNKNIKYLKKSYTLPKWVETTVGNVWIESLPASNEGRLLGGAGNALRFIEDAELTQMVDEIVGTIADRQRADGYVLPYNESFMESGQFWLDTERRNYDRAMFTKGMLAAAKSGNEDAYTILRDFYDWFNASKYVNKMLDAPLGVQGHIASTQMYLSPVGVEQDLIIADRFYVQDWWMDYLTQGAVEAIYMFPLNRPHCYLLTALTAYLDHYIATGDERYLNAVLGGYKIYYDNYMLPGGSFSICEENEHHYLPGSYHITRQWHTGETCGSVFWVDINSRLLSIFPNEEKYANEIERSFYNILFANQGDEGHIRYHTKLNGTKDTASMDNTCCEITATSQLGALPQYVYSLTDSGVNVNLFTASEISFKKGEKDVTLSMSTAFPKDTNVSLKVKAAGSVDMTVSVRIPAWLEGKCDVYVNGTRYGQGTAGTYLDIIRTWQNNDEVTFKIPMSFRSAEYTGASQVIGQRRYSFEYGPLLMALQGDLGIRYTQSDYDQHADEYVPKLELTPKSLLANLVQKSDKPLYFDIKGIADYQIVPYYEIKPETTFSVFPILNPESPPNKNLGLIIGLSVGGGVLVAAGVVVGIIIYKKKRKA